MVLFWIFLVLVVTQGYTCGKTVQSHTHTHTDMSACLTGEIQLNCLGGPNVIFLVFVLHYNCLRHQHREEGTWNFSEHLSATSCESTIISK